MYDELHYWLVLGSSIDNVTSIINDNAFGLSTDFVIAVPPTDTAVKMLQFKEYLIFFNYSEIFKKFEG